MTTIHPQARSPDQPGATPSHNGRPFELDTTRRVALHVAPAAILGSMVLVFLAASHIVPSQYAVFAGLPVYWLVWCLAFPLWVVGRRDRVGPHVGLGDAALGIHPRPRRLARDAELLQPAPRVGRPARMTARRPEPTTAAAASAKE